MAVNIGGTGGINRVESMALDPLQAPETPSPHTPRIAPESGGLAGMRNLTRGADGRKKAQIEKLARQQKLAASTASSPDHVDEHGETGDHKPAGKYAIVELPGGSTAIGMETQSLKLESFHHVHHDAHHSKLSDTEILPPEKQGKVSEGFIEAGHGVGKPDGKTGHDADEPVQARIKDLRKDVLEALANEKDPAKRAEIANMLDRLDKLQSEVKPSSMPHSGAGHPGPDAGHPGVPGAGSGIVPLSELEKMNPQQLAAFQASQTVNGMAIQMFMAQLEQLSEIVKKGSNAAAHAIG